MAPAAPPPPPPDVPDVLSAPFPPANLISPVDAATEPPAAPVPALLPLPPSAKAVAPAGSPAVVFPK